MNASRSSGWRSSGSPSSRNSRSPWPSPRFSDTGPAADAWGNAMYAVMFGTLGLGIPAACAVAILKYRLYDIDVVISKTLVYAVLAGFITAVYVLLVVGVGVRSPGLAGSRASGCRSWRPRWSRWRSSRSGRVRSGWPTAWSTASGPRRTRRWRSCRSGWRAPTPPRACCRRWPRSSRERPARAGPMSGCAMAASCTPSPAGPRTPGPGPRSRSPAAPCPRPPPVPTAWSRSGTTVSCWGRCR